MSGSGPQSIWRVQWILFKIAYRRHLNRFFTTFRKRKKKQKDTESAEPRKATGRKGRRSVILPLLLGAMFLFSAVTVFSDWLGKLAPAFGARSHESLFSYESGGSYEPLRDLRKRRMAIEAESVESLGRQEAQELLQADVEAHFRQLMVELRVPRSRRDAQAQVNADAFMEDTYVEWNSEIGMFSEHDWSDVESSRLLRSALLWVLTMTTLFLVFTGLGSANKDLGKVDWGLEWLYSFPIAGRALFLSQILELTWLNAFGWIVHLGLFLAVFFDLGYEAIALPLAFVGALCGNLVVASFRVLAETLLRRFAGLAAIKNVQALCTVLGSLSILGLYALIFRKPPIFFIELVDHTPAVLGWFPHTAISGMVGDAGGALLRMAYLLASTFALAWIVLIVCERSVRRGLISSGGVAQGRRGVSSSAKQGLRGMIGKEVRLVMRDRNFMVQCFFVPIFIFALQLVLNPSRFENFGQETAKSTAVACAVGVDGLLNTGPSVVSSE